MMRFLTPAISRVLPTPFLRLLIISSTALAALCSSSARASIIYVDFNNNPQERAQITKSRNLFTPAETTFYIPAEDPQNAQTLQALTAQRDQAWVRYTKKQCAPQSACNDAPIAGTECATIYAKLKALENASDAVPRLFLTADILRHSLTEISTRPDEHAGNEPITLVLSGHFGGGAFTGNLGSLAVSDIKKVFSAFPNLQKRVGRIFLLGCYTNTYPQVTTLWRDAFPNARVIAGSYGQSTRGDSPENLAWINSLISDTAAFDAVKTEDDFKKLTASLANYAPFSTALVIGDFYQQIGAKQIQKMSDATHEAAICEAALSKTSLQFYEDVFNGVRAIPAETNHSPLRTYYEDLRNHATCLSDPVYQKADPLTPDPDQVIRLILYPTVESNFRALHAKDLANFDALVTSIGVEPRYQAKNVNLADRHALLSWVQSLSTRLDHVNDQKSTAAVRSDFEAIQATLVRLETYCVPFSWVEPGSRESSPCFHVPGACK